MAKIITHRFGFNPVLRDDFECPICGSKTFAYLVPFGGLWCEKCNADFQFKETSDGQQKVAVRVNTTHCLNGEVREVLEMASTVIWESDEKITWLFWLKGERRPTYINPFKLRGI